MANVNDVTVNYNFPIPNLNNTITYDIGRLRTALSSMDALFSTHAAAINTKEATANKGVANGYAPLGADTLIPSQYLPSYVDDVVEAAALANFPVTGETGKIYVATGTGKTYRWSGSVYIEINTSVGSADTSVKLTTPRTISTTGDGVWSVTFDGTANVTAALTLKNSGVTAGTYDTSPTAITPITVDAQGRITGTGTAVTITPAFASLTGVPTTIAGFGITNAYTKTEVDTAITSATPSFSTLTGKPTTLSGYGITDAATSASLTSHANDAALHLTAGQNTFIDAITASSVEVNYLVGVTSAIQTQLNAKLTKSGATWADFT
jgi:hypothetical protein